MLKCQLILFLLFTTYALSEPNIKFLEYNDTIDDAEDIKLTAEEIIIKKGYCFYYTAFLSLHIS